MHEIVEHNGGLALIVDGHEQALIRERGGCLDLVWAVRGPQDLDIARQIIVGLLDLMVHYDALKVGEKPRRRHSGSKFG